MHHRRRDNRSAAAAVMVAAVCVALVACAADGVTGSDTTAAPLRERALAAGLAPIPAEPPRPLDNPYDSARVELGHLLFFDPVLSGDRDVACGTCHLPRFAFGDGRQFAVGAGATGLGPERTDPQPSPLRPMPRNSPTVLNAGIAGHMAPMPSENGAMFWGANAFGIEDQVLSPIAADNELRGLNFTKATARDSILARLRDIPEYVQRFRSAFAAIAPPDAPATDVVTTTTLRRAIAAYVRELLTPHAPIDAYLGGDESALSAEQREGLSLFIGKANCVGCHRGPALSDFTPHVLGVPQIGIGRDTTPGDDIGWAEVGGTMYAFRTPPLRQVALTPPYFHDGSAATLEDVVRFKNAGRSAYERVPASALDARVRPLALTDAEIQALVAFMYALTDSVTTARPLFRAPDRVPSGLTVPR